MNLDIIYAATGVFLVAFSWMTWRDSNHTQRWGTAAFWLLYGLSFLFGSVLPDVVVGLMVIALTGLAAMGFLGKGNYHQRSEKERRTDSVAFGNKLFLPAVLVPLITFAWASLVGSALIGLGVASLVALLAAVLMTRGKLGDGFQEGRRLIDAIGWAAILSQFLAALGYLFGAADVGTTISTLVSSVVPETSKLATVAAYCVGMALFTMIMGNAFAAFAVITAGIGIPMVIVGHGGDPAVVGVLGMLAGYCGTLMTPMAANFNVVPAALLELDDKNHVVKVQAPLALCMLVANIALMYTLAF